MTVVINYRKNQIFQDSEFSTQPYTLLVNFIEIYDETEIENEIMSNGKTNEQLSIEYEVTSRYDGGWGRFERNVKLKIKKFGKKKQNQGQFVY